MQTSQAFASQAVILSVELNSFGKEAENLSLAWLLNKSSQPEA